VHIRKEKERTKRKKIAGKSSSGAGDDTSTNAPGGGRAEKQSMGYEDYILNSSEGKRLSTSHCYSATRQRQQPVQCNSPISTPA